MAAEKTVTKKAPEPEQLERELKVLNLRLAGATWAEIAQAMGYAGPSSAYYTYQKAAERMIRPKLEEYRDLELDRLDRLQRGLWKKAAGGDPRAVDSVLRIIDRRAKLLGLDAPQNINLQAEVVTYDGSAIEQRTIEIIELVRQAGGTAGELGSSVGATGADTD